MLLGLSHALASTPTLQELGPALIRWTRAAIGGQAEEMRALVPRAGRFDTVGLEGRGGGEGHRAAWRRRVFETKTNALLHLRRDGHGLQIIPLVCRGQSYGLIEVVAPIDLLERARPLLEAVASQGAIALRAIQERSWLRRRAEAFAEFGTLSRDMVAAGSPSEAVRAATVFCHHHLQAPVAGWLARVGSGRLELVATRGVGSRNRRRLRGGSWILPRSGTDDLDLQSLIGQFGKTVGSPRAELARTKDAVLVAGENPGAPAEEVRRLLDAVAQVLEAVLEQRRTVRRAEIRNQRLDLGIAWTAHELRGPLLALRGFLDLEAHRGTGAQADYGQAYRELDEMLQQLDGLLQWAAGVRALRRRPTDLMRLVKEAVGVCTEELSRPVSVTGPDSAPVVAEPGELRRAITNVVRNALAYSPPDEPIDVSVEQSNGSFVVSVHDKGPGVPAEEAESIFDPFVRGPAARGHRGGRGLGLFIARRVVEAHGGYIWVEPARRGATFLIKVPR